MRLTRRAPRPQPAPPAPPPGLLQAYGAKLAPDFDGWWVYAFADRLPNGEVGMVWYVGQTENLWSRWRDHSYRWKERFPLSAKYAIAVSGREQADVTELALIDYYQPECNLAGTTNDLRLKVSARNRGNHLRRQPLDSGQVNA